MYDFELKEREAEDALAPDYHTLYHDSPVAAYWDRDFWSSCASAGRPAIGCSMSAADLLALGAVVQASRAPSPRWRRPLARHGGRGPAAVPGWRVLLCRAHDLPFADGSFDVVVCSAVLHHIPAEHLGGALDEIVRVLDEHGRIVIREPSSDHEFARSPGWFSGAVMSLRHLAFHATRSREYPEPPLGEHHHVPDSDDLLSAISERLSVLDVQQRFPFSSYLLRVRSTAVANLARQLDARLQDRPGTMIPVAAAKNHVTADDVRRTVRLARAELPDSVSDEEFLAYVEAAASEIERLFKQAGTGA